MIVNVYGSTGVIGKTFLRIIKNQFPENKINLLCAKNNIKLLVKQCKEFNTKYVYLDNPKKINTLRSILPKTVKILNKNELKEYLNKSRSDLSILSVSGYESLKYLELICINTDKIGIVSKEAIVSAGHILKNITKKNNTKIFPLDSEHFSIFHNFNKLKIDNSNLKKIYITASGGPFINKKFNLLKNVSFKEASNHPKWKMGYKNSIDSATLVNKCLELIEAHYLFDVPFSKLDILIHPESLVHSIIEDHNYVSKLIYFYNDMKIPIINFLTKDYIDYLPNINKFNLLNEFSLNFSKVDNDIYPIYNYFKSLDKSNPRNLIKFNLGNEYAVDLFRQKKIKYIEIFQLIKEITSLNIDSDVSNIHNIIQYHEDLKAYIKYDFV